MLRRQRILLLVMTLLASISKDGFPISYVPIPIEELIRDANLIVIGTVIDTYPETDQYGIIWSRTTLEVEEILKTNKARVPATVELATGDGTTDYLTKYRAVFEVGKKVLALLVERDGRYYGMGLRGKLDVNGDMIEGTDATVVDYKEAIARVVDTPSTARFDAEFPTDDHWPVE